MSAEVLPVRTCVSVWAVLVALTLVNVVAAFVDLGFLSTPLALSIALVQALLAMTYFMDLRHSDKLIWIALGTGVFVLAILMALTMSDMISRGWLGVPGK